MCLPANRRRALVKRSYQNRPVRRCRQTQASCSVRLHARAAYITVMHSSRPSRFGEARMSTTTVGSGYMLKSDRREMLSQSPRGPNINIFLGGRLRRCSPRREALPAECDGTIRSIAFRGRRPFSELPILRQSQAARAAASPRRTFEKALRSLRESSFQSTFRPERGLGSSVSMSPS